MERFIQEINSDSIEIILKSLQTFCNSHVKTMKFEELDRDNVRSKIWQLLFDKLSSDTLINIQEKCLETLKILSRDKTDLDNLITDDRLHILLAKADLTAPTDSGHTKITREALKLLYNLIFHLPRLQVEIIATPCLSNLLRTIKTNANDISYDVKIFDMKILFLITAFNPKSRLIVVRDLRGIEKLTGMLECFSSKKNHEKSWDNVPEIVCEILKVLFNLYTDVDTGDRDKKRQLDKNLVHCLHKLLVSEDFIALENVHSNIVNLLTAMPYDSLDPIIQPATDRSKDDEIYGDMDMSAISQLFKFLDKRLNDEKNAATTVPPALTALLKLCKNVRLVRKYSRKMVLPPLKDIMHRPEEGSTLKAKLCKYLTSPIMELRYLAAEFLFVICKENVSRMIKYTGYGNAAGMLANKGLLGCKQLDTEYSSDSSESDTEEYSKFKEDINPVTGCYEKPRPNPFEGMSEEQKEYEAMQLVKLVNQLTNDGVIRPCRIGDDGKPKPVEHVLELQEGLNLPKNPDNDSD